MHGVGYKCSGTLVLYFTAGNSRLFLTKRYVTGPGMFLIRCFAILISHVGRDESHHARFNTEQCSCSPRHCLFLG